MKDIRLYISDNLIDLDANTSLAFTYQMTDSREPTAVKNSFSKTVKLLGTERNRAVFAEFCNLDNLISNNTLNPLKRLPFVLFVNETIVERGYCKLLGVEKTGKDVYSFNVGLFGGLGEFFYNLQNKEDSKRTLQDLDFKKDLSFIINAMTVQSSWDSCLSGELPTITFIPMHNGVPKNFDADKVLVRGTGSGIPSTTLKDNEYYYSKNGYLLAKTNRKYTEWEMGDLRSYLQRPALRLKDFISAVCDGDNNGGWEVSLDEEFFSSDNPYYENTYIILPQLNTEEKEENVCDDGKVVDEVTTLNNSTIIKELQPYGNCLQIQEKYIDLSSYPANSFLKLSLPIQARLSDIGDNGKELFMSYRYTGRTAVFGLCYQAVAEDSNGQVIATSPRYVLTNNNHNGDTSNIILPNKQVLTSDAYVLGRFLKQSNGDYLFTSDDTNSNTFALMLDKIPRPDGQHKVKIKIYFSALVNNFSFNKTRRGNASGRVVVDVTQHLFLSVEESSNNYLHLIQPTQFASDSRVTQQDLFANLEMTPLDLLLSITKQFGLLFLANNKRQSLSILQRKNFYTDEIEDISKNIDLSKSLKIKPLYAEEKIYRLENNSKETTLSQAYTKSYGRSYGGVIINTGNEFGGEKKLMEKNKLNSYIDGALSGNGYWDYFNSADERMPSFIADGAKVTYYRDTQGETKTTEVEYNLFNVARLEKRSSAILGVAEMNEDGESKSVEIAPALVFVGSEELEHRAYLSDDMAVMQTLNNAPCYIYDTSRARARIPKFQRVATFNGETYSLDFGTPKETYYIPSVSLTPSQALYARYFENFITDLFSINTKVLECYVLLSPQENVAQLFRKFYFFDGCIWVLNKIQDYEVTKQVLTKCEFIRVLNRNNYLQ